MKGLALDVIWALIIAIAGVTLFLALVTGTLKNAANWIYCDIYLRIVGFFGTGSSIPESCKSNFDLAEKDKIVESDNKIVSRRLLAYIIKCWIDAEAKGLYKSHPCYEIELTSNVDNVLESNVTDILLNEDHCKSIENSDYGCGAFNQIIWSVDGPIVSLTQDDVAKSINTYTVANPIPVTNAMIPPLGAVKSELQLNGLLSQGIPSSICSSLGAACTSWSYNKSMATVSFIISSSLYNYSIDMVVSNLERNGLINASISSQKMVLIGYDSYRNGVEVLA